MENTLTTRRKVINIPDKLPLPPTLSRDDLLRLPAELQPSVVESWRRSSEETLRADAVRFTLSQVIVPNETGRPELPDEQDLTQRLASVNPEQRAGLAALLLRHLPTDDKIYRNHGIKRPGAYQNVALNLFAAMSRYPRAMQIFSESLSAEVHDNEDLRNRLLLTTHTAAVPARPLIGLAAIRVKNTRRATPEGMACTMSLAEQILDETDRAELWHELQGAFPDAAGLTQITWAFETINSDTLFRDIFARKLLRQTEAKEHKRNTAAIQGEIEQRLLGIFRDVGIYHTLTTQENLKRYEAIDPVFSEWAVIEGAWQVLLRTLKEKDAFANVEEWIQELHPEHRPAALKAHQFLTAWITWFDKAQVTNEQLAHPIYRRVLRAVQGAIPELCRVTHNKQDLENYKNTGNIIRCLL